MNGLCECGCGQPTLGGKHFARGHHMRTPEARLRISVTKSSEPLRRDLSGQRFHKLTVIEHAGYRQYSNGRESQWKCRCDCGAEPIVPQRNLVGGNTKSCGCIIGKHKRTHGGTNTTEFRTWDAMRRRCADPKNTSYADYGGRGITVCERWQQFANFLADMGRRPNKDSSIDRINNDGNYEPGNCRWTSRVVQSNNRRSSRYLKIGEDTKTLAEWEHFADLRPGCIFTRLKMGWKPEEVLQPSVRGTGRRKRLVTAHVDRP